MARDYYSIIVFDRAWNYREPEGGTAAFDALGIVARSTRADSLNMSRRRVGWVGCPQTLPAKSCKGAGGRLREEVS